MLVQNRVRLSKEGYINEINKAALKSTTCSVIPSKGRR